MLIDTPDLEKQTSKRSSQLLDNFALDDVSNHSSKRSQEQKISNYLREESNRPSTRGRDTTQQPNTNTDNYSPAHSLTSAHSRKSSQFPVHSEKPSPHPRHSSDKPSPAGTGTGTGTNLPRPSFMTKTSSQLESDSPGHTVARHDLRASAEKILYTFILPGSEREIILPQHMVDRMIHAIEEEGRDDPEVFDDAKDYVFQAMERDAYPGFLQAKALGNLVPLSVLLRLIIGLLCLGAGLWAGYWFILRDIRKSIRCVVSCPSLILCVIPLIVELSWGPGRPPWKET